MDEHDRGRDELRRELSNVQKDRTALIGFSLAAYLALSVGSRDPQVRTVIDFCRGLPEELGREPAPMPPTLILHGEANNMVAVSKAHPVEALMRRTNSTFEIKIYPGVGRIFSGLTMLDAAQRTLAFLRRPLPLGVLDPSGGSE